MGFNYFRYIGKTTYCIGKLDRDGENLLVNKGSIGAEALIDEGGYGFEPSLYIVGKSDERVCKIVEDLGQYMVDMV